MAKLVVTEGNIAEMKVDDLAVAIRRIADHLPAEGGRQGRPGKPEIPEGARRTASTRSRAAWAAASSSTSAPCSAPKQTALMYVYKDGKFKTKLRLDKVEKQHSVGFVVDGTMEMPPSRATRST